MSELVKDILIWLMSANLVVGIVAYLPQIRSLIKADCASKDVSISAWLIWTYMCVVALLYVIVFTDDILLILFELIGLIGCALVLGLAIYNQHFRFRNKKERHAD